MSFATERVVLDTSVLISAAIYPRLLSAQAAMAALLVGRVYRSEDTFEELRSVLTRPKFDRYFADKASSGQPVVQNCPVSGGTSLTNFTNFRLVRLVGGRSQRPRSVGLAARLGAGRRACVRRSRAFPSVRL